MAYGGDDGVLQTGEVCFVRPVRYKRRKYRTSDLLRVYRYVIEEEGFEVPTCALLSTMGVVEFARENLDALRDIPCVGTGLEGFLPGDAKDLIKRETGVDVDNIPLSCQPNTVDIAARVGGVLAVMVAMFYLVFKIKRNPILKFVLRRIFLFAFLEQLFRFIVDAIGQLVTLILWAKASQSLMEVLSCQRDDDGKLKEFGEVVNLPPEITEIIGDKINER